MDAMFPKSVDVVVVGARVAGAATAMLLARAGRTVLLVDRGEYGTDTCRPTRSCAAACVQLARWNLLRPHHRRRHAAGEGRRHSTWAPSR